ncbi:MAG: hypothetical protein U9R58_09305 [Chloroflexota bacterium]|nr:hypothetical protein [Chloroflexota bacterium]
MMIQAKAKRLIISVALAILIITLGVLMIRQVYAFSSDSNLTTQSIPIPPTPNPDKMSHTGKPIKSQLERSISNIVNLAKEIPSEEIYVYIIQRENGSFEEYYIPATYSGDVKKLMNLGSKDEIVTGYPYAPIISTPVLEAPKTESPMSEPEPTGEPYPVPLNTVKTPIIQPYP